MAWLIYFSISIYILGIIVDDDDNRKLVSQIFYILE